MTMEHFATTDIPSCSSNKTRRKCHIPLSNDLQLQSMSLNYISSGKSGEIMFERNITQIHPTFATIDVKATSARTGTSDSHVYPVADGAFHYVNISSTNMNEISNNNHRYHQHSRL